MLRRAEDLCARCARSNAVTHTGFLTPLERLQLENWARGRADCRLAFFGGDSECERTVAFFLPEWLGEEEPDASEEICALRLTAYFGTPGHRDYLGAALGMGIGREWLGDIRIFENVAYLFCLKSVQKHLLGMEKVGRISVKAEAVELQDVPGEKRQTESRSFSVMSLRLDAVTAGLFHLSRTEAARQIAAGNVYVNYEQTLKTDQTVREGDILSLRGAGKGRITGTGGNSRKGRLFVYGEIYK